MPLTIRLEKPVRDETGNMTLSRAEGGLRFIGYSSFSMHFLISATYFAFSYTLRSTYLQLGAQFRAIPQVEDAAAQEVPNDVELEEPPSIVLREAHVAEAPRPGPQPQPFVSPASPSRVERPASGPVDDFDQLSAIAHAEFAAERMKWSSSSSSSSKSTSPPSSLNGSYTSKSESTAILAAGSRSSSSAAEADTVNFGALERQFPVGSMDLLDD